MSVLDFKFEATLATRRQPVLKNLEEILEDDIRLK